MRGGRHEDMCERGAVRRHLRGYEDVLVDTRMLEGALEGVLRRCS